MEDKKSTLLNFRIYPRYKKWLKVLASKQGLTISQYLCDIIKMETWNWMRDQADEMAYELAAIKYGVPPNEIAKIKCDKDLFNHLGIKDEDKEKKLEVWQCIKGFYKFAFDKCKISLDYRDEDFDGTAITSDEIKDTEEE
jgi:hypothetical protein